jgi:hypothetical protein
MHTVRPLAGRDNRAAQLNPEHIAYHRSRGLDPEAAEQAALEARRQHFASAPPATAPSPTQPTPNGARPAR